MTKYHADVLALIILGALAFFFGGEAKSPAPAQQAVEVRR
jgi:hypothetical protein